MLPLVIYRLLIEPEIDWSIPLVFHGRVTECRHNQCAIQFTGINDDTMMMTMTTTNVNDPAICVRTRFDRRNVPEEACLSLNIQVILENDVE
jgi:hypothetical protein